MSTARTAPPESSPAGATDELREQVLGRLNPAQREAAECVRGPVAILAGAGTGKTTTVTHRIAWQVASGTFAPRELLAVTFTDKAAGELRERLVRLGVVGVEARTFHGAARWMLSVLWEPLTGRPMPQLMPHKIALLEDLVRRLPAPDCFRPRREVAQEIEWAKNRRVGPDGYLDELAATGHEQPLRSASDMQRIYAEYERAKEVVGAWDFEDLLIHLADLLDAHPEAVERLRARFRAITVDEYQDVNPLQQALLDHWTGAEHDICVVGDDYQTIYAFTGASPEWLLRFPDRHPGATVVRLEESYRSHPPVLDLANRLVPHLGGFEKVLRSAAHLRTDDAPEPVVVAHASKADEAAWVAAECRRLHAQGIAWEDMAVLYRINARSPEFESALARAEVPYVVTSGAFLQRTGPRGVLRGLEREWAQTDVAGAVRAVAERTGWRADGRVKGSDEAQTLQADLQLLVELAATGGFEDVAAFRAHVEREYRTETAGQGVELLTMHRAKGLEWQVVILPRLNDRELPFRSRTSAADEADERRLLYVAITRAKRRLYLSRAADAGPPSPFLRELGIELPAAHPSGGGRGSGSSRSGRAPAVELDEADPWVAALRTWRSEEARRIAKPAYVVFDNRTLAAIAAARPGSVGELAEVAGVGPAKLERWGEAVLDVLAGVGPA
jgi:DNA helicase-2/ATP-dependent DNA helicase PcrA